MSGVVTDAQLLDRARAGATEAYVDLFARHHQAAVTTAGGFAGAEAADDVVAEAFVRILACLDEGGGPRQSFGTYLDVTLHHAAVQHLRRDRGPEASAAVPEVAVLDPADPRADRTPALQTFALLTPSAQVALWLREVEQVPATEVGELLGVEAVVAEQLARRAAMAFGQQHPGPLADLLLPLVVAEPVAAPASLTLVPPPAAAPAAPPVTHVAARRSRWLPALAVAASVSVVGVLAVSLLGRGPVDVTSHQEAAVAPPVLSQTAPLTPGINGGRMAPAVLGGLVDGRLPADDATVEEIHDQRSTKEFTDDQTAPSSEEAAPEGDNPAPSPEEPIAPPTDEESVEEAPPTETLAPPTQVVASETTSNDDGGHTVGFDVTNAVAGSVVTFTLAGDAATIDSVSGGACEVAGTTATCTLTSGGALRLTVSLTAPAGGTLTATVPRGDGTSATASATVPAPAEELADELTPTTPAGGPADPSSDPEQPAGDAVPAGD